MDHRDDNRRDVRPKRGHGQDHDLHRPLHASGSGRECQRDRHLLLGQLRHGVGQRHLDRQRVPVAGRRPCELRVSAKLGYTPPPTAFSAAFQPGANNSNSLTFVVNDVSDVTGLDYSATVTYQVRSGPVQNLLATPGNTTAVLSWAPPSDLGSEPLSSTAPYVITVAGSGSGTGTVQVPPSAVQPCLGNAVNVCYNVSGLTNGTDYTFTVQAQTGAGLGDSATAGAKPSADSQAAIVAPQVAQTLTTCKYATVAQPVCDVYTVPKGGGGVFGLTGNVPVAGNFCGGAACNGNGADTVFPAAGYADPKHPIVDTVTFDRSVSPRGIFTQVFYQRKTGDPFQLKFCKNPFVANPDPCISTLIVLFNPFNPVVNGDVQVRILLTSGSDSRKAHR